MVAAAARQGTDRIRREADKAEIGCLPLPRDSYRPEAVQVVDLQFYILLIVQIA